MMPGAAELFDPYTILAALERNYVEYVVVGGLARVLRGTHEITGGVDICPSLAPNNVERLAQAAGELDARPARRGQGAVEDLARGTGDPIRLRTSAGEVKLIAAPVGVPNGFVDLRRAARREDLGHAVRPLVASTPDLARMAAALHREQDVARLRELRRIMELEVERELTVTPVIRASGANLRRVAERDRGRERGLER